MKNKKKTTAPALFPRSSGVLMHISSLPGDYGMGTFGKEAKAFIDLLVEMGCRWWQTLPFGPIDGFNSPYKSLSAFAGNIYFIDPEQLASDGLLTQDELNEARDTDNPWVANFEGIKHTRKILLHKAFLRCSPTMEKEIDAFVEENAHWLPDYALCQAIQKEEGDLPWSQWSDAKLITRDPKALADARERLDEVIRFHYFMQYIFMEQWQTVKNYANEKGIGIIGDMPIYVDVESSDVWVNPQCFEIDKSGRPNLVAGVPPDYFSADGQLWGNPVYDWTAMKKDGYKWWIDRLAHSYKLFDTVRIDHFRAFSAYWAVKGDAETAREGKWMPGPGMDLFNTLFDTFDFSEPRIIAEDLGVVDDGVIQLLADTGFPGMGVMQFGFIDDRDNQHLPHNYSKKTVAYTGTHDNNTLLGWMWELPQYQREYAFDYIQYSCNGDDWQRGGFDSPSCHALIQALWRSGASVAIVPVQDLCGFGGDTKMNKPGEAGGNWAFRIPMDMLKQIDISWIKDLNRVYKR